MSAITESTTRTIVNDFALKITERKRHTAVPSKTVINFRTDRADNHERDIYRVPIELLRYRKDNGRIASDVQDHERSRGPLDETNDTDQRTIAGFLQDKDPEKNEVLRRAILHDKQQEPAIITCDGFLINGNRRKLVIDKLHVEFPNEPEYEYMKVVLLPAANEEGGAPTLLEIERLENRYQLQSDGRSEYYGFDRALSIKRKIEVGLLLRDQLRDDPRYATATERELQKAVKDHEREYLEPLDAIDRYLDQCERSGQYRTISSGISDPEGRWQAFKDYSRYAYKNCFQNAKSRLKHHINENEVGAIETAAFQIIRLRDLPGLPKVHQIMRDLPKYCSTAEGKKAITRIAKEVRPTLPEEELGPDGVELSAEDIDAKWAAKYKQKIIWNTKLAAGSHEDKKDKETPLGLLEAAYKKLTHEDMQLDTIRTSDYQRARKLIVKIGEQARDLESQLYQREKNYKKLTGNKKS